MGRKTVGYRARIWHYLQGASFFYLCKAPKTSAHRVRFFLSQQYISFAPDRGESALQLAMAKRNVEVVDLLMNHPDTQLGQRKLPL